MSKIFKLMSYYKPYKKVFFLDLFFAFVASISTSVVPLLVKYLTNDVTQLPFEQAIPKACIISSLIILIFFIIYFCKKFTEYQGKLLSTKIETNLRTDIFKHIQKMSFSFFDEHQTGKLISLLTNDAFNLSYILKDVPETAVNFVIKFVFAITVFFLIDKTFCFISIGIFLIIIAYIIYVTPKILKKESASHELFASLTANLNESLSGIKTTKSFTNENIEMDKFKKDCDKYLENRKSFFKLLSSFNANIEVFIMGLIPLFSIIEAFCIINGNQDIGDLITIMLFIDILFGPIFSLIGLTNNIQSNIAGLNRIFSLFATNPTIVNAKNCIPIKNVKGKIEFKNATFKYNNEKGIFENLNFKINSGEYIAIVGSSGSGKSTLCNLIPRFYELSEGEICIDGHNIKNIELKSLRKNIGFVQQDTFLFSGSIKDNIAYGKPNCSFEEIVNAAKSAYAHEFIMNLPQQYDTKVGERGSSLSGGQKQRIAIARVFLKNPPILIFDEATSSLDNESERYIQKSLEKLANTRTTIVIAHRLATIRNADRIFVVSNGKIAQEGTHDELISKNGIYANLAKNLN